MSPENENDEVVVKSPQELALEMAATAASTAVALATTLGTLNSMSNKLVEIRQYGHKSRKFIIGLAISLFLDITLSVLTVLLAVGVNNAQNSVQHVNFTQCVASNEARAQDALFLNTLLNDFVAPGTKVTPENAAAVTKVNQLRQIVRSKDAQRDCVKLYG